MSCCKYPRCPRYAACRAASVVDARGMRHVMLQVPRRPGAYVTWYCTYPQGRTCVSRCTAAAAHRPRRTPVTAFRCRCAKTKERAPLRPPPPPRRRRSRRRCRRRCHHCRCLRCGCGGTPRGSCVPAPWRACALRAGGVAVRVPLRSPLAQTASRRMPHTCRRRAKERQTAGTTTVATAAAAPSTPAKSRLQRLRAGGAGTATARHCHTGCCCSLAQCWRRRCDTAVHAAPATALVSLDVMPRPPIVRASLACPVRQHTAHASRVCSRMAHVVAMHLGTAHAGSRHSPGAG
eukprot:361579-Chlamydomonas_euryale.AAC.9